MHENSLDVYFTDERQKSSSTTKSQIWCELSLESLLSGLKFLSHLSTVWILVEPRNAQDLEMKQYERKKTYVKVSKFLKGLNSGI